MAPSNMAEPFFGIEFAIAVRTRQLFTDSEKMRLIQEIWNPVRGWKSLIRNGTLTQANFILHPADINSLIDSKLHKPIAEKQPDSNLIYCSTASEIAGQQVFDASAELHHQTLTITTLKDL